MLKFTTSQTIGERCNGVNEMLIKSEITDIIIVRNFPFSTVVFAFMIEKDCLHKYSALILFNHLRGCGCE